MSSKESNRTKKGKRIAQGVLKKIYKQHSHTHTHTLGKQKFGQNCAEKIDEIHVIKSFHVKINRIHTEKQN